LYELQKAIGEINDESLSDIFSLLVQGKRLRDISDLPFDLAI
nr:restriction endonuclease [Anaerolineae bacterium]